MIRATTTLLIAVTALGACSQKAAQVSPSYVSSAPYLGMSCAQLGTEAASINARAADLSGKQDKAASNDAALTAVSIILFWPAAFFIGGNDDHTAELSAMKGQAEAIRLAATQKGCGG